MYKLRFFHKGVVFYLMVWNNNDKCSDMSDPLIRWAFIGNGLLLSFINDYLKQPMKNAIHVFITLLMLGSAIQMVLSQTSPDQINFVRQGVQRLIFDVDQSIPLARLEPENVIDHSVMYPVNHYSTTTANVSVREGKLVIHSMEDTETAIWFAGFNPFATYSMNVASFSGAGNIGFEFSNNDKTEQLFVKIGCKDSIVTEVRLTRLKNSRQLSNESISSKS